MLMRPKSRSLLLRILICGQCFDLCKYDMNVYAWVYYIELRLSWFLKKNYVAFFKFLVVWIERNPMRQCGVVKNLQGTFAEFVYLYIVEWHAGLLEHPEWFVETRNWCEFPWAWTTTHSIGRPHGKGHICPSTCLKIASPNIAPDIFVFQWAIIWGRNSLKIILPITWFVLFGWCRMCLTCPSIWPGIRLNKVCGQKCQQ